jgi:DNA-binding MarR family transcriptional regulator
MARAIQAEDTENERLVLDLLNSVEADGSRSQRHIASELGIALGLVNAYLKRCVKKGLVKVGQAPARRYAYYLTPQGFAEKSRLTVDYLSTSFSFFRQAKADCASVLEIAKSRGFRRLVLAGQSDLAEIAYFSATNSGVSIVALVDKRSDAGAFAGIPIFQSFDQVEEPFDAVVVTDVRRARETFDAALAAFGEERVFAPSLLGLRVLSTGVSPHA